MISNTTPITTLPTGPTPDALIATTGPEQLQGTDLFGSLFAEAQDARLDSVQLPPPITGLSVVPWSLPGTPTSMASSFEPAPDDAHKSNSLDETHKESADLMPISAAIDAALQIAGTFLPQGTMPRVDAPPPVISGTSRPIEFVAVSARMPTPSAVAAIPVWAAGQGDPVLAAEQVNIAQAQAQAQETPIKANPGQNTVLSGHSTLLQITGLDLPPVTSAEIIASTDKTKVDIVFPSLPPRPRTIILGNTDWASPVKNSALDAQITGVVLPQNFTAITTLATHETKELDQADTTTQVTPDGIVPVGNDLLAKGTHHVLPTIAPDKPRFAESGFELRQINLATDTLWLDNLARDIASAAQQDQELSFRLMPKELGRLDVNLSTSDTGLNVKMTTSSEESRAIFSAHQPRLLEELRVQGIKLTGVEVETGAHHQSRRNGTAPPQFIESSALAPLADEMTTQEPLSGRFA